MLLQSTFPPCDSAGRQSRPRLQLSTTGLFASPIIASSSPALSNLFNACRSLQSLMFDSSTPVVTTPAPLPTPVPSAPMKPVRAPAPVPALPCLPTPPPITPVTSAPAPTSPPKLRLRVRKSATNLNGASPAKTRIVKRAAVPRAPSKLHRAISTEKLLVDNDPFVTVPSSDDEDDEMFDCVDVPAVAAAAAEPRTPAPSSRSSSISSASAFFTAPQQQPPATPKRTRIAPEAMPLGLERRDFHDLHIMNMPTPQRAAEVDFEADGSAWTAEDDRVLLELVLGKMNMSKAEWQECARSLGKDCNSLGRRWQTLMAKGIKSKPCRRAPIHATWR
jgi:hypothetical protein